MDQDSKGNAPTGMLGFLTKRDRVATRCGKRTRRTVAYGRRVRDDPDTGWVDWDEVMRELADKDDSEGR